MVMRPKGKAILVLSAVFLLGAVAGAGTLFALHMKEQSTDEARDWSRHAEMRLDAAIRKLLTPAQQEKFDQLAKRQEERIFRFGGRGFGGRGRHGWNRHP